MDWLEILRMLFTDVVIPLLGVAVVCIIRFVESKRKEVKESTDNAIAHKYADMIAETITSCVITTNQTYVDSLKGKDAFTHEAQKEAFERTLSNVKSLLTAEMEKYIQESFGDVETFLKTRIEEAVALEK